MNDQSPDAEVFAALRAANSLHGEAKAFIHVAGYTLESGFRKVEALLEGDKWRECGFDSLVAFADSIRFDKDVRIAAEQRKKFVLMFEEANKREEARKGKPVSNTKLAETFKVGRRTIDRDSSGPNGPLRSENTNNNKGTATASGPNVSGAQVAKLTAKREERFSANERRDVRLEEIAKANRDLPAASATQSSMPTRHGDTRTRRSARPAVRSRIIIRR
jgi:hypothetical protein